MQLELSAEDVKLLVELLARTLGETRVEARHTADRAYRESLHADQDRLRQLIDRLRALS